MSDGPEWFAPKRYGYGAGLPIAWQGWVILLVSLVVAIFVGTFYADQPIKAVAIMIPVVAILVVVSAKTTRGGWRWRWGEED